MVQQGLLIVGFAGVWVPERFIHHLYISPEHQGRGIGRLLLTVCRERYGLPMQLKCLVDNHEARDFYETQGWVTGARGTGPDGPHIHYWLHA